MAKALRSREELRPDDILTLADACAILLNGLVTPAGLRKARDKGDLSIVRINGRDYVTPSDIKAMIEKCRVEGSRPTR